MKKVFIFLACCLIFGACNEQELIKLKAENTKLRTQIEQLQRENEILKETDQYYYQQGLTLFEQKKYELAKEKFTELINKFPNSTLITNANHQIDQIAQNRKEATNAINSLSQLIAKTSNAIEADNILQELEDKYNYEDVKQAISGKRQELQARITKEREMEGALKDLGIEISNLRTYWSIDPNVMGGRTLVTPYMRFNIKNVGNTPITRLKFSASFELTDKKEVLGTGSSYVISLSEPPLKPGYSKEVFFGSDTGYRASGYDEYRSFPKVNADMYVEVNGGEKRIIKEITISRKLKY